MSLFDEISGRLRVQNEEFLSLTSTDPMTAARSFAEAHHALTAVYNDPRASRAALAEGLAQFQEAAAALAEALKEDED